MFLLHGTPGSRKGPKPKASLLYRLGIKLIAFDRPGYGGSTRHIGRSVADGAADVAAVADQLGIDRFAVVGRSGGGPHALACAALLPDRVARALVLVSVANPEAPELNWFEGMSDDNVTEFTAADEDPLLLIERLSVKAMQVNHDPESLVLDLESQMTDPDRRVVKDTSIRRLLHTTYLEALRGGPHGWIDDVFAFRRPWGFALGGITIPVRLWHGEEDNFAPAGHTRWIAGQIPTAMVEVQSGAAHFGAFEILPTMLRWLTEWRSSRSSGHPAVGHPSVGPRTGVGR